MPTFLVGGGFILNAIASRIDIPRGVVDISYSPALIFSCLVAQPVASHRNASAGTRLANLCSIFPFYQRRRDGIIAAMCAISRRGNSRCRTSLLAM